MQSVQIEWLNQNSLRAYPFMEGMQRRPLSSSGSLMSSAYAIPNCLVVDFVMSMHSVSTEARMVYLKTMSISDQIVSFVFGDRTTEETVASASVPVADHKTNQPYLVSGIGDYDDAVGTIVVGDIESALRSLPDGTYSFSPDETTFEARCVRPSLRAVRSVSTVDSSGAYQTKRLYDDVKLVAGQNIRPDYRPGTNEIWIHADSSAGYNEDCDCSDVSNAKCIKYINGISVENVTIEGGECVKVTTDPSTGRIVLEDICSKPCCGCAELSFLNMKLNEVSTTLSRLEGFEQELSSKLDSFVANALSSTRSSMRYR